MACAGRCRARPSCCRGAWWACRGCAAWPSREVLGRQTCERAPGGARRPIVATRRAPAPYGGRGPDVPRGGDPPRRPHGRLRHPSRERTPVVLGRSLERDVVVAGDRAATAAGGRRGEVVRVDRNVGLRGEAVATAARGGVVAAAEELHAVGDDAHALALVPLLALPLAPLEAAVDRDGAALGEVPGAVVALRAPDGDVEVVGLVDPLTGLVLAARVAGDAELADRGAAREGA